MAQTTEQQLPPARKFGLVNVILIIVLGALLCGEAWFGYSMQKLSSRQERIREDLSTIKSITFSLFSVDQWRDKMSEILDQKVSDYTVTPEQKKALLVEIEQQMNGLIDKTLAGFNKPQKSLIGKIKKLAVNKFVDEDQVHALVPTFAQTIVTKVTSPASTQRLKNIVNGTITKLENETYDSTEGARNAVTAYMYRKYHVASADQLSQRINSELLTIKTLTYKNMYAMLGCVLAALVLWLLVRKQAHLHKTLFFMSLLFGLVLLAVGITSSIIQVDAQLKTVDFKLMGQKIPFGSQDLFFQSKSIWQIVQTLVRQPKPDAVMVGILILLFIIILPIVRIIARGIHILSSKRIANNRAVRYLAFESAKWDMSDVMVVGILMTYIGLNSILKSQLSNIDVHDAFVDTTPLNSTTLQPGYFVFVGYVVFTIILAIILKRITPQEAA